MRVRHSSVLSHRGVALVITLILLSVILVVTLALLAISRRERSSVATAQNIIDAEYMANAAMERAKATLAVQIISRTNMAGGGMGGPVFFPVDPIKNPVRFALVTAADRRLGGDLLVSTSTNSIDPSDYKPSYITNLQYDARVPVFIRTNRTLSPAPPLDFRFFLDLNRNAQFESNGFFPIFDLNEQVLNDKPGGPEQYFHSGDPEWLGVTAQPGLSHSATNRFVGRYAFLVAPAGRTLDINAIHNAVGSPDFKGADGYSRNQGFGTYEINLAAFLADLNTNIWANPSYVPPYQYNLLSGIGPGFASGSAFDDARSILRYRYADGPLPTLGNWLGAGPGARALAAVGGDNIDSYGNDSQLEIATRAFGPPPLDNDSSVATLRWPGTDNPRRFGSMDALFRTDAGVTRLSPSYTNFVRRLKEATAGKGTYNRYSFYRMLSQLGTDTGPGPDTRINLNYKNTGGTNTLDFVPWTATEFFNEVADRLIKGSLTDIATQDILSQNFAYRFDPVRGPGPIFPPPLENLYAGNLPGIRYLAVTNIQVYPTNYYNPALHRLLQVSANLYEPHGTNYPTIHRPHFRKDPSGTYSIAGYAEDDGTLLLTRPWGTLQDLAAGKLGTNDNVYGVPPIFGARKGFPSLNEIMTTSIFDVSRKLLITKRKIDDDLSKTPYRLNELLLLSVSNLFSVELLNSYTNVYPRALRAEVHGFMVGSLIDGEKMLLNITNRYDVITNIPAGTWRGGLDQAFALRVPLNTNFNFLPVGSYEARSRTIQTNILDPVYNVVETFASPNLTFRTTNYLRYFLVEVGGAKERVVDAASLSRIDTFFDISQFLHGSDDANDAGGTGSLSDYWNTNRLGGSPNEFSTRTVGVTNQVKASLNPPGDWRNYLRLQTREDEVANFKSFFYGMKANTNLFKQTPYTAYKTFYQSASWQANDPLLHHIPEQMLAAFQPDKLYIYGTNYGDYQGIKIVQGQKAVDRSNIGRVNTSHRRWGPVPKGEEDAYSFDVSVKDPQVAVPDHWSFPSRDGLFSEFPTNVAYASVGWIGKIHRGTPWQTIFLKATNAPIVNWLTQVGVEVLHVAKDVKGLNSVSTYLSYPTNDWSMVDLFTVAPTESARRGAIGVNQSGLAAWSAVLSGVVVFTNGLDVNGARARYNNGLVASNNLVVIQPASNDPNAPLLRIVNGINRTRALLTNGFFNSVGQILAVPELSTQSPFLNFKDPQDGYRKYAITEEAYERIPRQILSLIRTDEPRFVIYAFGQSLQPAADSLILNPLDKAYYGLCTNYQIMAEVATKTVVRFENIGLPITSLLGKANTIILKPVVESFEQLPPDAF